MRGRVLTLPVLMQPTRTSTWIVMFSANIIPKMSPFSGTKLTLAKVISQLELSKRRTTSCESNWQPSRPSECLMHTRRPWGGCASAVEACEVD